MRIGLAYDLRAEYLAQGYSEEDAAEFDSGSTIDEIERALSRLGHSVERVGNGRTLCRRITEGARWDLVFNVAEGVKGRSREAQVPCLLEMFDVPYTFSDPLICAVTLDKAMTKRLVRDAGLRTARFVVVSDPSGPETPPCFPFPVFAKPVAEGTGKGIDHRSLIGGMEELRKSCGRLLAQFNQPVLVEEYLPGREFTTGILGTGPNSRVLGTMDIRIRAGAGLADYSFKTKEECESLVEYTASPPESLRDDVEELALSAYRTMECRDAGRVDIRLDAGGLPCFMELNPLPGLHPTHSDLPMIATQQGMSYGELIGAIVESAVER